MITKNDVCPYCGGPLQRRGFVKRIMRIEYGKKIFIKLPRYSCKRCGKWHRYIPDNIVPFKHYRKDIIDNVERLTEEINFEDYPSDITRYRWTRIKNT